MNEIRNGLYYKGRSRKVKPRQMSEVYKKFLSGKTLVRKEIFSG